MRRVFLGGTCGNPESATYNHWREYVVMPLLMRAGIPEEAIINPVVLSRTTESDAREAQAKQDAHTILFFHITHPGTPGNEVSAYSIFELVMALYDHTDRVVISYDRDSFSKSVARSIESGMRDIRSRFPHAPIFDNLADSTLCLIDKMTGR